MQRSRWLVEVAALRVRGKGRVLPGVLPLLEVQPEATFVAAEPAPLLPPVPHPRVAAARVRTRTRMLVQAQALEPLQWPPLVSTHPGTRALRRSRSGCAGTVLACSPPALAPHWTPPPRHQRTGPGHWCPLQTRRRCCCAAATTCPSGSTQSPRHPLWGVLRGPPPVPGPGPESLHHQPPQPSWPPHASTFAA